MGYQFNDANSFSFNRNKLIRRSQSLEFYWINEKRKKKNANDFHWAKKSRQTEWILESRLCVCACVVYLDRNRLRIHRYTHVTRPSMLGVVYTWISESVRAARKNVLAILRGSGYVRLCVRRRRQSTWKRKGKIKSMSVHTVRTVHVVFYMSCLTWASRVHTNNKRILFTFTLGVHSDAYSFAFLSASCLCVHSLRPYRCVASNMRRCICAPYSNSWIHISLFFVRHVWSAYAEQQRKGGIATERKRLSVFWFQLEVIDGISFIILIFSSLALDFHSKFFTFD